MPKYCKDTVGARHEYGNDTYFTREKQVLDTMQYIAYFEVTVHHSILYYYHY